MAKSDRNRRPNNSNRSSERSFASRTGRAISDRPIATAAIASGVAAAVAGFFAFRKSGKSFGEFTGDLTTGASTRIKDVGTLRLDGGRTHSDEADRKGMGWMTFQDGIAYSRNVVAAKVALDLGDNTRESSAALHDPSTW